MNEYLPVPFNGWRITKRYLISPDGQHITPERLTGLLWRDEMELRLAGFATRRRAEADKKRFGGAKVKVVVVELFDWHREHFGSSVG